MGGSGMQQAVDTGGESGLGRGEGGVDDRSGRTGDSAIAGASGGADDGLGEEQRAARVALNGIVIGSPVRGGSPGRRPGIAGQEIEAREKAQKEELPVVAVQCMGALVVEGDGERFAAEALLGQQIGGDDDERPEKTDERDRVSGAVEGENGRGTAVLQGAAREAARAREAESSEQEAEATRQGEAQPQGGGCGEDDAKSADAFDFAGGFEAQIGRNADRKGHEESGERRGKLNPVESAFAAARRDRLETAQGEARAASQSHLQDGQKQSEDDEQQAKESQGPGEGHDRGSFLAFNGSVCARAERMLDSS